VAFFEQEERSGNARKKKLWTDALVVCDKQPQAVGDGLRFVGVGECPKLTQTDQVAGVSIFLFGFVNVEWLLVYICVYVFFCFCFSATE
jgi:hypothetical protein